MYTRLHADKDGLVGNGVKFERIRRVTGYLVGTLDRFNNGKRAEEHDRVKHMHLGSGTDVEPQAQPQEEHKPPQFTVHHPAA